MSSMRLWVVALGVSFLTPLHTSLSPVLAQEVGDMVRMESSNIQGVPVHPAAGNNSYERWANGTVGTVMAIDGTSGWRQVESNGRSGWVTRRYLTVVFQDPGSGDESEEGDELLSYVVGTWNLEYFRDGATRGFPEYTRGGPRYGPRTEDDFRALAGIIEDRLGSKIMILNEVAGRANARTSAELDRLVGFLGTEWAYDMTLSGRNQRVAVLYDTSVVRRDRCEEIEIPHQEVDNADILEKDPLVCLFTLLDGNGDSANDLLVVGLHLASGQENNDNHNAAIEAVRVGVHAAIQSGQFPAGERDVLIGGDLNASRYDSFTEDFWEDLDSAGFQFRTMSPSDGTEYPGTRLAGVPLFPRSQIDYLIASGGPGGLMEELVQLVGQVHTELLPADASFNEFRMRFSDHLPVTVRIRVVPDDDGS